MISAIRILLLLSCAVTATAAEYRFKVGGNAPPGTPWEKQWQRFAENVTENSSGVLKPTLYVRGQLGSPDHVLATTRRGRVHLGGFPLAGAAAVVPELSILLSPFIFDSAEEADFVMDRYLLDPYKKLFAEKGLVMMQWLATGWNNLYGKRSLANYSQAKGYRMRVLPTKASQLFLKSLKADMVPLPFTEVFTGLQTGLIEGGESSTIIYLATGMSDIATHLTLTRHAFDSGVIVANKRWYEKLPPKEQQIIGSAISGADQLRTEVRGMLKTMLARKSQAGVTVHRLSPQQRQEWKMLTADQHQRLIETIGGQSQAIYELILLGKKAFREQARLGR